MCIALFSTAHPLYPLILINNRDEYLDRPTAPASYWPAPHDNVLGGRDLLRSVQGTWLGITKQGRIAVLTNFREEGEQRQTAQKQSRGMLVKAFLTAPPHIGEQTGDFVQRLIEKDGVQGMGGFSLVCGKLRRGCARLKEGLAIVSNRTDGVEGVTWIANSRDEIHGLSNTAYVDRSWSKVLDGERLMKDAIGQSVAKKESKEEFVERLFRILSVDTLPSKAKGEGWESYLCKLRKSIFIPAITNDSMESLSADNVAAARSTLSIKLEESQKNKQESGALIKYGTQKQTVVLVNDDGVVRFIERTLYDQHGQPVQIGKGDRSFEFKIEGWDM